MATSITNKGNALLAKLAQGIDLELTSAKAGAGTVDASHLKTQTGVTNIKQDLAIASVNFPESGTCSLVLQLSNKGVTTGYTLTQIGIYARDPDEGEILFAIWQVDGSGVTVHSETVLPGYNAEWSYNIKFDQADSVVVNVDPANTVSQATMETYVNREVKNITAAKIGLGNVDNTADSEKYVRYASTSGTADKTKNSITVHLNGGQTEGTSQFTFNGSTAKSVNITPSKIGAAEESHTHDAEDTTSGTFAIARIPTITVAKGGTGSTNGATGLKNLFAAGNTILSSYQYGTSLPAAGNKGRIFFKKVSS